MNNKLLSGILLVGIATTGFAGYSSANNLEDESTTNVFEELKDGFE